MFIDEIGWRRQLRDGSVEWNRNDNDSDLSLKVNSYSRFTISQDLNFAEGVNIHQACIVGCELCQPGDVSS